MLYMDLNQQTQPRATCIVSRIRSALGRLPRRRSTAAVATITLRAKKSAHRCSSRCMGRLPLVGGDRHDHAACQNKRVPLSQPDATKWASQADSFIVWQSQGEQNAGQLSACVRRHHSMSTHTVVSLDGIVYQGTSRLRPP